MRPLMPPNDVNLIAAGVLWDLALAHAGRHARLAYKRAARSVLGLEQSVASIAREHGLRDVPYIGVSTERILLEFLQHGHSAIADRVIEESGKAAEIEAARKLRTNFLSRAAVIEILKMTAPGLVGREHYLGDFQMHSDWSDGTDSIEAMARGAMARGQRCLAITDHSYGLRIAHGISMEDVARQHEQIDTVNARLAGRFRVLQGIEANIRADGTVDMEPHELRAIEIVVAAPHSGLRRPEDQTERMLTAVRTLGVHILGHPRGRMVTRPGVLADWDAVFHEAARRHVAIELDGDPWRQDLDWTLARRALRAGCLFSLDSDAHSVDELRYSDWALAHARLAGIPPARVINTWPLEDLEEWSAAHRNASRAKRRKLKDEHQPTNGHHHRLPSTKTP